jgi:hypothetical protein
VRVCISLCGVCLVARGWWRWGGGGEVRGGVGEQPGGGGRENLLTAFVAKLLTWNFKAPSQAKSVLSTALNSTMLLLAF